MTKTFMVSSARKRSIFNIQNGINESVTEIYPPITKTGSKIYIFLLTSNVIEHNLIHSEFDVSCTSRMKESIDLRKSLRHRAQIRWDRGSI